MERIYARVTTAWLAILMIVAGLACETDDEPLHNPSLTGGNPSMSNPGKPSGDDDPDDDAGADLADAGDAGFDREACREDFVNAAVGGTMWYWLECGTPREDSDNECVSGSHAEEIILNLRDDENASYWLNVLEYDAWANKNNLTGAFCRGPDWRENEVGWRMIGCNTIELKTGCGTTETATLDGKNLRYDRGDEGTVTMRKRTAEEIQSNRQTVPTNPNGQCHSRQPADDTACPAE